METWGKMDQTTLHFFRIKEIVSNKVKKETKELLRKIIFQKKYFCEHQIND